MPQPFNNRSSLRMIDVSHNQLHGQLPRSLANCVILKYLILSNNQFSDVFPIWLGTLPKLKLLAMHHNGFNNVIGQFRTNVDFSKLCILHLSYNNFTGEIPPLFPNIAVNMSTYMQARILEGFAAIDISSNKFEGKIPEFIGNLKELLSLNISSNILKGSIPEFIVFYVWFDAPTGYVSITKCYTDEWEKWWKNPENVELYQFMGKDNMPFHTVMFPSTLLGNGENWTLMKTISVTEHLNYEAGKFSKSKGIGVFGNEAKDINIPVEVSDTLFTWAELQAKLNSELLNNLGNFINRVLSFVAKPSGQGYGSIIPDATRAESDILTEKLAEKVGKYVEQYIEAMEKVKLQQGLKTAMSISGEGNAYLQESQFWKLYKEDQPRCAFVIKTSVGLVHLLACLLEHFMPSFSLQGKTTLGDCTCWSQDWETRAIVQGIDSNLVKVRTWTQKDEEVESFRKKFAGSQANRKEREEAEAVKVAAQLKKMKVSDNSGKKKQQATKSAAEAEISISRLDIRVGLITKAQKHPYADSLHLQEIDVGDGQTRTVVSGLVKYIPIEENQNWKVCVLCNIKPATMRGIKSQAMVLAALNSDHATAELVNPPKAAQIFYVWFDAPIGYVSITKCYTDEWEKWWKNPENVELYQFMGKDNMAFHTLMFRSTLLGTGENWTLMKTMYLNYEAGKFSKSKGIGGIVWLARRISWYYPASRDERSNRGMKLHSSHAGNTNVTCSSNTKSYARKLTSSSHWNYQRHV
ncbi:unnamed protein product [Prunus armeniaca]|uniref:methionine--tRNA ligase n=1 Tax=Prunus armeniaca TaxID=36596 RepID=A0A6J5TZN8_PRUAR|nr:unnamed protein product [Prunus armeniaca]